MTVVLARLRVRTRRRKPKPPWWRLAVVFACVSLAALVYFAFRALAGDVSCGFYSVEELLLFVYWWPRVVADTEKHPPPLRSGVLAASFLFYFIGAAIDLGGLA